MAVPVRERKLTLEAFLDLERRYPERRFKPDAEGAVIEMSPSRSHGFIQGRICSELLEWLSASDDLSAWGAGTEITHDLDGWICVPDVAVLPREGEDYPREAPLLAVEIESRSNTRRDLRAKALRYLERGAAMVWLVYPQARSVELYRAGAAVQALRGEDVLEGGATLPGLRLALSDIFPPHRE